MKKILLNIRRLESKFHQFWSNLNRRMQNRESAVRSRQRRRYHQDDLEVKIEELEAGYKVINEENAGLTA